MDLEGLKQLAAEKAVEFIESGMVVGLGTGSTAIHATRAIGRMLQDGQLQNIVAIPTSEVTARAADELMIPLTTLDQHPNVDLTIDGADEIDPRLDLIKGLGGALLREKIVACASKQLIIVSDDRKRVPILGSRAPVPVEVIPFAYRPVGAYLESLGARVVMRTAGGRTFITDEGNIILDAYFDPIADPNWLAQTIRSRPGVVEHGLFLNLATMAIVASPSGIEVMCRT